MFLKRPRKIASRKSRSRKTSRKQRESNWRLALALLASGLLFGMLYQHSHQPKVITRSADEALKSVQPTGAGGRLSHQFGKFLDTSRPTP